MLVSNQLKNQHLLWRAGFGPMVEQWKQLPLTTSSEYYKALVKASEKKPEYFRVAENAFDGLITGIDNFSKIQNFSKEQKQKILKKSRDEIRNLNLEWIDEMVNSDQQLREKAAFFWHGHFACRNLNVLYQQQLVNTIRENALGNFGDLLHEVSKKAGMLAFLNNQQNKKQHPNENFAREVMELFTLGRGNYTETDVKEAARAFTGWSFRLNGEFQPRPFQHDYRNKTVLGKTGNFDGDDVLDILLEQKQTARFITKKIYRFYVNENEPDKEKIEWLAGRFYQSNYNIRGLLDDIFTSEWFYDKENVGSKIKSPVELLVGARKTLPIDFQNKEIQLLFQRILGQVLFYPPNVAGWPGGQNWIDSSSLMFRLRFPQLIAGGEAFNLRPKDMDDGGFEKDMMTMQTMARERGQLRKMQMAVADIKWEPALKMMESTPKEKLMDTMMQLLWQSPVPQISKDMVEAFIDRSSREAYIKTSLVQLMSTPEYQMC